MPFDGNKFFITIDAPPQPSTPRRSLWSRLLKKSSPALDFAPSDMPVKILEEARKLIEKEENWVQGRYETIDGRRCAIGALRTVARSMRRNGGEQYLKPASNYLHAVAHNRGFTDAEKMNDRSAHEQVLSAFDEAIVRAVAASK